MLQIAASALFQCIRYDLLRICTVSPSLPSHVLKVWQFSLERMRRGFTASHGILSSILEAITHGRTEVIFTRELIMLAEICTLYWVFWGWIKVIDFVKCWGWPKFGDWLPTESKPPMHGVGFQKWFTWREAGTSQIVWGTRQIFRG